VTIQDLSEHTELIDAVARQEKSLMTDEFRRTAREFDERQARNRAFDDLAQGALLRLLKSDPEFARGLDALAGQPDEAPDSVEIVRHSVPDLHAELGQRVMSGGAFGSTTFSLDPPYQYHWEQTSRVQADAQAQANPLTGGLWAKGTIASIAPAEPRSFYAAAGVAATFMRRVDGYADGYGPEGIGWITPSMPDAVRLWTDRPQLAVTSLAGVVGILVRSYDMNGSDRVEEMRTLCGGWRDEGWMFGTYHDPQWGDPGNFDPFYTGSLFGYQSPAFRVRPHRLYMVWVYGQVWGSARHMWLRSALAQTSFSGDVKRIAVHQT